MTAHAAVRPATDRIDAIVGRALVLAVTADDERELLEDFAVTLDDGRNPAVSVFRLEPGAPVDAGWIGLVPRWTAVPAIEANPSGAGAWYAVIDLPVGAVSQGLWIDGLRHEVNWLPDPERADLEAGGVRLWASPVPRQAMSSPHLADALEALDADPFQRWRVRLALDGLAPAGASDRTGPDGTELSEVRRELATSAGRGFLDALARHHEARWQLIFGRLALIDAQTAARLRRALAGVAFIDGAWRPFWSPDSAELRALQLDLLSPWVDDQTRVLRARAWLDAQARAVAWVIDDAGEPAVGTESGDSRMTPTLGLVSLPAVEADLLVEVAGSVGAPVLSTAPPRRMVEVRAGLPMLETRGRGTVVRTNEVVLRVGRTEVATPAVATVPSARPPGFRLGPLLRAWTMPALIASSPAQGALEGADRLVTGVLRRQGTPGREGVAAEGWSVYLCCAGEAESSDVPESVTIWTGPYGLPNEVWRISRDGTAVNLFGGGSLTGLRVVELADGWALDAGLPASAVDEDGVLRIGLVRETGDERTSWPRRMTPGQEEPGRLGIDVGSWDGF